MIKCLKLKCSQTLLVTNWYEETHQLVDRMIRDDEFHTDCNESEDEWRSQ